MTNTIDTATAAVDDGNDTSSEALNAHSGMAERLGRAGARLDAFRGNYSPQTAAAGALYEICLAARFRTEGAPCGGAMFVAPYGSGKTCALEMLRDHAAARAADGSRPVLLVPTSTMGTVDSLPTSILSALGAPRPDAGNEKARWSRALDKLRQERVDLVVFDEWNRAARRPTMSGPMVNSVAERIMNPGIAAVAFVGSEDASVVLNSCPHVVQRLDDHIDLAPLDWLLEEDRDILTSLLEELDGFLVHPEMLHAKSGLSDAEIARKLCEASNGRIRSVMKIVRGAMLSAIRRGSPAIEDGDLYDAVDIHAVRGGLIPSNPFV